jgi:sugar (pentulose or hexulose) kinase
MPGPYLIGVDCGTQSAKVVIYDAAGTAVWDSIAAASREAIGGFDGDLVELAGVGLCTIRCCKAFLDADGSLIEPIISWMDDRAYQAYLPDDPSLAHATTTSGYIGSKFTGSLRDTAANNVLLQWPIDTDTWQWSDDDDLFERFGLSRDLMVDLQMPGDIVGLVTVAAAAETGIPVGIPVVATANDKAVEMLGAGTVSDTTALVSLGTYIAAMVPGTENHHEPAGFWTNFACVPNRYLYESNGVRRGMWTLTWLLDLLGPELAARAADAGLTREEYIEREAVEVPAGSDGLMTVLDWLAPTDQPFRKGVMLGFDARHTRGHIYRSILEAIALTMKQHVDEMCAELEIALDEIVVSGGGSASPLFMQIFADVFGMPARRSITAGGASLGAAICAAAATGVHPDIETPTAVMSAPRQSFAPERDHHAVYSEMDETVYRRIRDVTDPLLERSYPLFH